MHIHSGEFVRAVGRLVSVDVEFHVDDSKIDHVWVDIDAGIRLRLAVNTLSRRNLEAKFDGRVRVGVIRTVYDELPEPGVFPSDGLDYDSIETTHNVFYEFKMRGEMERLLLSEARAAIAVEAWGAFYTRGANHGVHQIHSRRASCAVPENLFRQDGALQFYYERDRIREMFLFKFCGQ